MPAQRPSDIKDVGTRKVLLIAEAFGLGCDLSDTSSVLIAGLAKQIAELKEEVAKLKSNDKAREQWHKSQQTWDDVKAYADAMPKISLSSLEHPNQQNQ